MDTHLLHAPETRPAARAQALVRCALLAILALTAMGRLAAAESTEVIGNRFAAAISAGDGAALNAMIDIGALSERVIDGLDASAVDKLRYVASLKLHYAHLGASVAAQMRVQRATAHFVRAMPRKQGAAFLVRIDSRDAGGNLAHGYLEVELNDEGRIVDWYDHATALSMSRQLRFTLGGTLSVTQVARLMFGAGDWSEEDAKAMVGLVATLQVGNLAQSYVVLKSLSAPMQARREVATLRVVLSRHAGMDAYREELAALAAHHRQDRELQLILIDHYLLTNDYEGALAAIDGAAQAIGNDQVMEANRCHVYLAQGRKDDAIAACDRAIRLDPTFDTPRWTRVRIGLETKDAALAIASLSGTEEASGSRLKAAGLARNDVYAWLIEQPEWAPWASARGWSAALAKP